jgi:hypothetical protein
VVLTDTAACSAARSRILVVQYTHPPSAPARIGGATLFVFNPDTGHLVGRFEFGSAPGGVRVAASHDASVFATKPLLGGPAEIVDVDTGRVLQSIGDREVRALAPRGHAFIATEHGPSEGSGAIELRSSDGSTQWKSTGDFIAGLFSPDGRTALVATLPPNNAPGLFQLVIIDVQTGVARTISGSAHLL